MKKLLIVCFVVVALLIPAYMFAASCESEEGKDPTAADVEQFVDIMMFFSGTMEGIDPENPPACVDMSEESTATTMTMSVTFNNCVFDGITVDGTMTMTITQTGPESGTIEYSGSLTMSGTGAPCSSVSFDMTMTIDGASYSVSGTVTIDGETFKASGFTATVWLP
jgi:hypothetical protein